MHRKRRQCAQQQAKRNKQRAVLSAAGKGPRRYLRPLRYDRKVLDAHGRTCGVTSDIGISCVQPSRALTCVGHASDVRFKRRWAKRGRAARDKARQQCIEAGRHTAPALTRRVARDDWPWPDYACTAEELPCVNPSASTSISGPLRRHISSAAIQRPAPTTEARLACAIARDDRPRCKMRFHKVCFSECLRVQPMDPRRGTQKEPTGALRSHDCHARG